MAVPTTRPSERPRVSAGHAIAVVIVALLLAALFDADSLVGSIDQEPFGTSRTIGLALARPVRTISHWTGLNRPHMWLDDLVHGKPGHAVRIALPGPSPTPPLPAGNGNGTGSSPASTIPLGPPVRRVATPSQPLKVWMAGDSLMGTFAESFAETTKSNPLFAVTNNVQIGTGLARPDVYDWPNAVNQELVKAKPDAVIFMFGANDDQDMQAGGHRVVRGTPAWKAEYGRRVSQLMALASSGGRQVIWLGIPAVKRPRLNETKDTMNDVVRATASQYPGVTFVDTGPLFDAPGGGYTTYLTGAGGQPVKVRENDGIHFTLAGANRLTPVLLGDIKGFWAFKS
jgi:lysophospholipase L1-like esterase